MQTAEPCLHERTVGRKDEIRQANRDDEQFKNIEDRGSDIERFPTGSRRDGRCPEEGENNEQDYRRANKRQVDDRLLFLAHATDQPVGISVPARKQDLKKQHHGRPDRRCAAEPGQDELTDHRLDLEKEKGGEKNANSEKIHGSKWCAV